MISKKSIFLLIIFVLSAGIYAQDNGINKLDVNGKKTGIWESYYPSGKIKTHGSFINGHPAGELLKYYPGGILQANMNFDETGRVSYVKMYYETGNLASEGKYIDQLKDSIWNYYSSYDKRKALSETMKTGKKHGDSYKYYAGGKPSEFIQWQNDVKHGKWEQYFENGQVRLSGTFKDGLQNGEFISYNPDGSLSITGTYLNGIMDGTWNYYSEAGDLEMASEYKDGKMLPNAEMEKRVEEFSKKVKDAIGNLDDVEITEFQ